MLLSIVGLLYAAQLAAAGCNEDNCLRAIIASAFPTRSGVADCSAYLRTTYETGPLPTVTVSSTTIPAYASACSPTSRYTSACACVGVSPSTTTVPETISPYTYLGCYTDFLDGSTRALTHEPALGVNNPLMTNEYCAGLCAGYDFFGTEYGSYCFCGNAIVVGPDGGTLVANSQCNEPCAGNTAEFCGAAYRISIWEV